jgi:hypothetical protein
MSHAMIRSALLAVSALLALASHAAAQQAARADTAPHHARAATIRPAGGARRTRAKASHRAAPAGARPGSAARPTVPVSTATAAATKPGCAGSATPSVALAAGAVPSALSASPSPLLRRAPADSVRPALDASRLAHAGAPPRVQEGAMCRVAPAGGAH